MKNPEQETARIESNQMRYLAECLCAGACDFATSQGKPVPERPQSVAEAFELLAEYLEVEPMSLKARIERLEETTGSEIHFPALIYFSPRQTLDQARKEYRVKYGYDLPDSGMIIKISTVDCKRSK